MVFSAPALMASIIDCISLSPGYRRCSKSLNSSFLVSSLLAAFIFCRYAIIISENPFFNVRLLLFAKIIQCWLAPFNAVVLKDCILPT